ncbi:MAG: RNA-binding protein [Ignavibacteriaceae bacterium]|jgi:RNA recognition motif-containing protein|nr:RNA-binding protein [Ignavibacteriaceae bacterium]
MNIFVGNLSNEVVEEDLMNLFSQHGKVREVKIIRDLFSQQSKGFGFVEMPAFSEAQKAIKELNTFDLKGKKLKVGEARAKRDGGQRNNRFGRKR